MLPFGRLTETSADSSSSRLTKYCAKCEQVVARKSHHCALCDYCVLRSDHHCFMVNGCVGFGNQRYFIVYLFYASLGESLMVRS